MKYRKSLSSLLLATVLFGTAFPAVVSATDTSSSSSISASSSSSIEPSSSVVIDPSTSSSFTDPSSSSVVEPSTSSVLDPSSSSVVEPSSSTTPSSTTTPSTNATDTSKASKDLFGLQSVLEAVVGTDDQYKVENTRVYPYRTVVHLEMEYDNGDVYVGSGVMIAPNLVLTVAHNVYDQETGKWATSVIATPGKSGAFEPYGNYVAANYFILRGFKTEGEVVPSNHDIAVIRLNRNVPASVGHLPVATSLSNKQRIQVVGYPAESDHKEGFMYASFGTVDNAGSILIGHKVDAEGGNSGSPILNSSNQIVGVHSAGQYPFFMRRPYGTYNWGRRVDGDVLKMIDIARHSKATTIDVASYRETKTGDVYRLYHSGIKRHLYTQSLDEANVLRRRGWKFEGFKFKTLTYGKPVYRLYSKVMREHLYTTSAHERDVLARSGVWRSEGIAFYSGGTKPVYRLYHSGLKVHLYTADENEKNVLVSRGWKYENISFYTL